MIDNPSYQDFATHDDSAYPELWDGCVGAWAPCLGPTGLRLHDMGGRANWGTLTNMDAATDWVVDGGRYALDFDGTNDFVDLSLNCSKLASFLGLTMSFWGVRRVSLANLHFGAEVTGTTYLDIWPAGATDFVYFQIAPNFLGFRSNLTTWAQYAMRWRPGTIQGFINGVLVASGTGPSTLPTVNANIQIGAYRFGAQTQFANGLSDDAAIWSRWLSDAEMSLSYKIGRGGMYTPRRRRKAYFGQQFNAAWARGANQFIQPSLIGVA